MKSKLKMKIIVSIIIGINLVFLTNNFYDRGLKTNYKITFNNENLKIAKVSGKIDISGNSGWIDFRNVPKRRRKRIISFCHE